MNPRPLRHYQEKCRDAVLDARARGRQRVLYVLPTGTGKTRTFVAILEALRVKGRPALVLAHRDELLTQAMDSIHEADPDLRVGLERGPDRAPKNSDVVVASVQTLAREGSQRLQWLADVGPSVTIYDEAHHISADGAQGILERFGAFDGRTYLVGCTATPKRLDERKLSHTFEEQVYTYPLLQAIEEGFLCSIRGYRVVTETDLSAVKTTGGDFNQKALSDAIDNAQRTAATITQWQNVAEARPTIVFCASVDHAEHAAKAWRDAGYKADYVHGGMAMDQRRQALRLFKSGITQVLCNVGILTEGFDHPPVSCVVMLSPTKSWSKYCQMAGRGTRIHPDKEDLIILDTVDNTGRHDIATAPAILDLPAKLDLQGHSLEEAALKLAELSEKGKFLGDYQPKSYDDLISRLEHVDLFANVKPRPEVAAASHLHWLLSPQGYHLSVGVTEQGEARRALLAVDTLGYWRLTLLIGGKPPYTCQTTAGNGDLPDFKAVDASIGAIWPDAHQLIRTDARWRGDAMTEKQAWLLKKRGVKPDALAQMSRGDASSLISRLLSGDPPQ